MKTMRRQKTHKKEIENQYDAFEQYLHDIGSVIDELNQQIEGDE